jgi:hypothetical protein
MALKVEHEDSVHLVLGVLGSGTVVIPVFTDGCCCGSVSFP